MRSYQAQRIKCERKLFGRLPPTLDCCLVDDKKSKARETKIEKLEIFEIAEMKSRQIQYRSPSRDELFVIQPYLCVAAITKAAVMNQKAYSLTNGMWTNTATSARRATTRETTCELKTLNTATVVAISVGLPKSFPRVKSLLIRQESQSKTDDR
jgi:hypothetical protein